MAKTQYWLVDETGTYMRADGAEERDRWIPRGYTVTDVEPAGQAKVWCRHDGIVDPATFPAEVLPAWQAQGWNPAAPTEPASPFNGDALTVLVPPVSQPVAVEQPPAAASGSTNSKEK